MEISQSFALEMVKELSTILQQHINFIDKHAMIIASSDETRISSCHMGAKKLIEENLPFLLIDSDDAFSGSKKGLNFPIVVDDVIVGVIGITGDPQQVSKYGQLLKKFTEMYIRDERLRQIKNQEDKIRSRFLEKWLLDPQHAISPTFADTAISLGIDPKKQYRVIVMMYTLSHTSASTSTQQLFDLSTRYMKSQLLKEGNHYCRIGSKMIYIMSNINDAKLPEILEDINRKVQQSYDIELIIGYDRSFATSEQLHQNYVEASKALKACTQMSLPIVGYQNLYLELLFDEISSFTRADFMSKIFYQMDKDTMEETLRVCKAYYQCDGSIQRAAQVLFIHKNTLQYKLQRITNLTSLDPRAYRNIPIFTLAIKIFEDDMRLNSSS